MGSVGIRIAFTHFLEANAVAGEEVSEFESLYVVSLMQSQKRCFRIEPSANSRVSPYHAPAYLYETAIYLLVRRHGNGVAKFCDSRQEDNWMNEMQDW